MGSIPGSERSPGEGNGNPLQYSYLENYMAEEPDGLHGVAKSQKEANPQTLEADSWFPRDAGEGEAR